MFGCSVDQLARFCCFGGCHCGIIHQRQNVLWTPGAARDGRKDERRRLRGKRGGGESELERPLLSPRQSYWESFITWSGSRGGKGSSDGAGRESQCAINLQNIILQIQQHNRLVFIINNLSIGSQGFFNRGLQIGKTITLCTAKISYK